MSDRTPKRYQRFFAELKRRHVFRVMAVYGAVAFVLLQLADLVFPALQLPPWAMRLLLALTVFGFPIAVVLAWAFEQTPEGFKRTERAEPEEIEAIVSQPASRRWPAGLLALVGVAALVAGAWWVGRQTAPAPDRGADAAMADADDSKTGPRLAYADLRGDSRPSIAVLPFADMSREGDQEYFSDGMTEEILNALANIPELRVSGRTSTFAYKGREKDLRDIGSELGVKYLVEGSVRKEGEQLRITAQLIDAEDGSHLWSESYDRTLESVFAIQSEIAAAIAEALRVPLGLSDPADLVSPTSDFDAYDLYLAARARMRERGTSLNEAVRLYEATIAIDSTWAPAWAGLAEALEIRLWYREPWGGRFPSDAEIDRGLAAAERAARRALQLDPRSASALVALGSVLRNRFQWNEAERAYREALALDPDNAEAHHQYAELLLGWGRVAESVREADRAVALDPAPVRYVILGALLSRDGRPDEARRVFQRGILVDPDMKVARLRGNLGRLYYEAGQYDQALEFWSEIWPDFSEERERQFRQWAEWMERGTLEAVPDSARRYLQPDDWMTLGEPDSAAAALAEGPDSGLEFLWLYQIWEPKFDPIRSHPRVQEYLRRLNLEGVTVERTPPEEQELPVVLREAEAGDVGVEEVSP